MVNKKQSLGKGIEGLGVNVLIPSKKKISEYIWMQYMIL